MARQETIRPDNAVESEAQAVDPIFGVEIHGLDPIPVEHRHGEPGELFWTWLGGNFNYVVLAAGAFTIIFGLNIWQAISAAIIGSVLGAIVFGFCGIFGPRTATATIVNTRAAFGLNGNFPAALISWLSASGWVAVNSVLAVFSLVQLAGIAGLGTGIAVQIAAVAIIILAQVIIALFGHATVVASERIFAVVSVVLIVGVMVFALPKVNWAYPQAKSLAGSTTIGTWFLALSVIMAGPLSWVNYASDYSRYFPARTSWKRIALMSSLGIGVSAVFGSLIGTVLATVVDMSNPIANLPKILPGWYLVPFLLVVIWGAIANNVLNLYTAGLGLLALRVRARRWIAVCLVGSLATVLTCIAIFVYNFMSLYAEWLSLTLILLAPWTAILLVDYFVRRGQYDIEGLHTWGKGPYWYRRGVNWSAIIVYLVGIVASLAVANSTLWASPLSTQLFGGADFSLFAGLIVTGILYYLVAKKQVAKIPLQSGNVPAQKPSVAE
ncbi:MAG TPA: cytosine permease [Ktedonobacteraceae bacterium]|nr:cytosine permease [Ktedonobacteraceae bacterium]